MKYQNTCFQFAFWMKIWVLRLNIHFLHEVQFLLTSISTCGNCSSILNTNKYTYLYGVPYILLHVFKLPNMPWVKMCQSFIILFSTVIHIYIYIFIYILIMNCHLLTFLHVHNMILYDLIKTSLNQVCLSVYL